MKNRVKELINIENVTSAQFAAEIGIAASSLHHIVSGRNNPSLEVIQKILVRFPQLNAEWLINGNGKRYKDLVQGELFNMPIDTQPTEDHNMIDDENIEQTNTEPSDLKENIIPKSISSGISKSIEKIVILYTDKSFDIYNP